MNTAVSQYPPLRLAEPASITSRSAPGKRRHEADTLGKRLRHLVNRELLIFKQIGDAVQKERVHTLDQTADLR